ncbi:MAG: recombinase family protein [Oscillospiraceae bacterium]|nr:recombinase family protein [Oscillospiraceae bacterium]
MPTRKQQPTCQPKTAVAYARYSSAQQRDVSIEQQLRDIRAYAEREGYIIIHEYIDRAKSGFKHSDRRAEFQEMLRAASSGMFDTVLAWKVDRFGRNRRESSMYKGQLADLGVSVRYAMEPIPDGAAGVLTEGMLEAIAEWYSRNLSENIRRGKKDNAGKALYNGIKIFGYDKGGDGHYVVNEADAALVRRVFSLYAQGNSVTTIENTLKAEGVLTANGVPFGHSRILYMITNEAYIGTYHFDGITIPGGLPAIIDRETWEVCQQLRQKTSRHYEKKPDTYIMSGKCTCGLCGGNVRGTSGIGRGHAYYYYICGTKRSKGTCNLPLLRKEFFEKKILDYLFDEVLAGELLNRFGDMIIETLKASRETSPISQMERSLHDIRRRIENINKAISEGIWTASTGEMLRDLTRQAEDMEKNISYHQLTEKKTISKDRVMFLLHKVADGNRADPEAVKTLIGVLVNSITVYEHWLRIVINAAEHVEKIPPEDLPPLDVLPDLTRFDLQPSGSNQLVTVEPYPVIVFKIAI